MALAIGEFVAVQYVGHALYHERFIIGKTRFVGWYIVLTPDLDVYAEELDARNTDLTHVLPLERSGDNGGLRRAQFYRFRRAPEDEPTWGRLTAAARLAGDTFATPGGILLPAHEGAPAVGRPGVVPVAPRPEPAPPRATLENFPGEVWIYAEAQPGCEKGSRPASLEGAVGFGRRGVLPIPGGSIFIKSELAGTPVETEVADLRVLPVKFDQQGERRRTFRSALEAMTDDDPEGGLVVLKGPRTVMWMLKDMESNGGDPVQHYEWWHRVSKLPEGDRANYEMEVLCRVLFTLATTDQLNLPALSGAEMLCRRISLIKEAHRVSPSQPDYSASDYFMGWGSRRAGATLPPQLTSHVAEALRNDAAIAKEARKAREEQVLRRVKKTDKKGGKGHAAGADG